MYGFQQFNELKHSIKQDRIKELPCQRSGHAAEERVFAEQDHVPAAVRFIDHMRRARQQAFGISFPYKPGDR